MNLSVLSLAMSVLAPSPAVKFDEPLQPLESLIPKLATWSGEHLSVSAPLSKEVVTIRSSGQPSDLLAKLATVVGGVWVKTSDGMRLDLDTTLSQKEAADALAARTALLKAEIDKLAAKVKAQPAVDPKKVQADMEKARQEAEAAGQQNGPGQGRGPRGQFGEMITQMPGSRAIINMLSTMRVEELAKVGVGQRVVFTSLPTRMQKPLPGNSVNVMRTFVTENTNWQSTFGGQFGGRGGDRQREIQVSGNPQSAGAAQAVRQGNNQQQQQRQVGAPAKAYMIATRFGGDGLQLQYIVADANGQPIGNGQLNLGNDNPPAADAPAAGTTQTVLQLSDDAKGALGALGQGGFGGRGGFQMGMPGGPGGFGGRGEMFAVEGFGLRPDGGPGGPGPQGGPAGQAVAVPPQVATALKNPVQNDPLNLATGSLWSSLPEVGDRDLIALIPDSVIGDAARFFRSNRTAEQLSEYAKSRWGLVVAADDASVTITPKNRGQARAGRVDRSALKTLIDAIAKNGQASLGDIANYAMKSPVSGSIDLALLRTIDPSAAQSVGQIYGQNRDLYLIYGSMGSNTRSNLFRGQTTQVRSLSTNGLGLLADMTFNSFDGPQVQFQNQQNQVPAPPQQGGPGMQRGRGGRGGQMGNLLTERTEVLANGVPAEAVVTVSARQEPVVKAVRKEPAMARIMTAQMMGAEKAFAENPPQQGGNQPQRQTIAWDGYVNGTRSTYVFLFTLANGVTLTRTLDDTSFSGGMVGQNQFSADFQNAVAESYQQMKEVAGQMAERRAQGQQTGRRGRGQRGQQGEEPPPAP